MSCFGLPGVGLGQVRTSLGTAFNEGLAAHCPSGLRTLVANSELAVCSRSLEAVGRAFATVIGPLAAIQMTVVAVLLNSPPVSLRLPDRVPLRQRKPPARHIGETGGAA